MKPEDLEIIELLDLARNIKQQLAGFANKDHKHPEYAPAEHEHEAYAKKAHKHGDYAKKNHQHPEYAPTEHSHPELVESINAANQDRVTFAEAGSVLLSELAKNRMHSFILSNTGKKPMHLYDFFTVADAKVRYNTPNSIIAPGKTFACRIVRHADEVFVLFDGILTD